MAEAEPQAQAHPSIPPTPGQSSANPQAGASVQNQEQVGCGQGLYAVQVSQFMGTTQEYPLNVLIPLTYKIPRRTTGAAGEVQGQGGNAVGQQHGPQRQVVVRRFQVAFQLDLALLLKLAFAVVLFGQDGSRQRTIFLVLLASLIYLYQTGVLTPLIQYVRRGLAPPRPAVRPQQNAPARQNDGPAPEVNARNEDVNANADEPDEGANQLQREPEAQPERAGMDLRAIAREIRTFVVGFITSLLPGFENHND